ncbi:MAG: calcium-binding protein [Anaerolineae bacterium]
MTVEDEERDERIHMEVIVDAYGPEEQRMSWYYYLEGQLHFPFKARCIREMRISPLHVGEIVEAKGMIPEEETTTDFFVEITWCGRTIGVPLAQLDAPDADEETQEAIGDWHYWLARGYTFC